jgi:sulfur relay (sulfurtransferase) DsrC/TusE family protein
MQIVLKDKLSDLFAKYFTYFQKQPDSFMTTLAEQIAKQTNQSVTQQHIDVERLQKDVLRFFELCTNKLIWSCQEDIQAWYNCNRLAHECQICLDNNVLCGLDAVDDMCWSLIHRFCYFVELSQPQLSKNFYAQVLHELQTKPLKLVALEEQEELMTSKKIHLMQRMQACQDMCKLLQS